LAVAVVLVGCLAKVPPQTVSASGATFYVSKSGSDTTGDGSQSRPWASIQKAANSMSGGDIVQIAPGTYNERVTVPSAKSGTGAAQTRFIGGAGVVVSKGFVLDSSYTNLDGFEITPGVDTGQHSSENREGQIDISGDHNTVSTVSIHDLVAYSTGISVQVGASYNTIRDFEIRDVPDFGITLSDTYNAGSDHTLVQNGSISRYRGRCAIELTGNNHVVEGVTIAGPSGTGSPDDLDGDGIRVNYSRDCTIRSCVIHDLWEYYSDPQHTDCIQLWVETYGLSIENCVLGTWQPGPANRPNGSGGYLAQEIGPSQIIMCGTVPAGSHVDFTAKNCLFLGQCGTNASIVTAGAGSATIAINLYNNTFWSSYPSLNSVTSATLRNNVFRSFRLYPANLSGINSDYNAFCWQGGSGFDNVPTSEGAHSIGRTYATRVSTAGLFVNPDIGASGGWGFGGASNFAPASGSPLINVGATGAGIPGSDLLGYLRDSTPDIGAYEYGATSPGEDVTPPGPVGSFRARGGNSVDLSWTSPPALDFWKTRVLRSVVGHSSSPTPSASQVQVYEGAATSYSDRPPERVLTYYTAFAQDRAGNWSTAALSSIDPQTVLSIAPVVGAPYGKKGAPRVRLLDSRGLGIMGQILTLTRSDGARRTMTQVAGAPEGTYSAPASLINGRPTRYTVEFAGDSFLRPCSAAILLKSKASIYKPKPPARITHRKRFTVKARLKPVHRNGTRHVELRFDRLVGDSWVRLKVVRAVVRTKRGVSQITARTSLPYKGRWRVCASHADYVHAETVSARAYFRVR
jgi:hypothetical protein